MHLGLCYNEKKITTEDNKMQGANRLSRISFFEGVKTETLDILWQHGRMRQVEEKTILFRAKEQAETIFIQVSGKSVIYNLTHTGKRKILFILGEGALLNDHVVNTHEASLYCETLEKSQVFEVPVHAFLKAMEMDFSLTKKVLTSQECKCWRLGHQLKNTHGSIYMERKLAAKLWKLSRDFGIDTPGGREIDVKLSVTFLADMLGAPRETTSKLCKALTEYGLIRMDKKRIVIISPQKMSSFYKTGKIE